MKPNEVAPRLSWWSAPMPVVRKPCADRSGVVPSYGGDISPVSASIETDTRHMPPALRMSGMSVPL